MLGDRLKELRKEFKYNQDEVADKLNVSRQAYGFWEQGKAEPGIELLIKLSNLYNVSIDYLCGKTDIKSNNQYNPNVSKYINNCLNALDEYLKDQEI